VSKRRNNKTFTNLGDVLGKIIPQYRPATDQYLLRVWDLWEQAVGVDIAANARPAAVKSHTLLVHVSNSTWLHHLRFLEHDLMVQLNTALGREEIRNIKFKIGPV
jgi:predicted nucleic acid-binding Zn ribbon protein